MENHLLNKYIPIPFAFTSSHLLIGSSHYVVVVFARLLVLHLPFSISILCSQERGLTPS